METLKIPLAKKIYAQTIGLEIVKVHPLWMSDAEAKEYRLQLHRKVYRLDKIEKILKKMKGSD